MGMVLKNFQVMQVAFVEFVFVFVAQIRGNLEDQMEMEWGFLLTNCYPSPFGFVVRGGSRCTLAVLKAEISQFQPFVQCRLSSIVTVRGIPKNQINNVTSLDAAVSFSTGTA
jgi:hypothetical protein